jgi:hypothetical protein
VATLDELFDRGLDYRGVMLAIGDYQVTDDLSSGNWKRLGNGAEGKTIEHEASHPR